MQPIAVNVSQDEDVIKSKYEKYLITEQLREDCLKTLSATKATIIGKDKMTFLVALLLRIPVVITKEITKTLAVDGRNMYVNPDFFMAQSKSDRTFIVLHEVLHFAYDHCGRLENRDPDVWSQACDYAVNDDLHTLGLPVPSLALFDRKYHDMSAEQIYDLLLKENNTQKNNCPMLGNDVLPTKNDEGEPESSDQMLARKTDLESMLLDAATQAEFAQDYGSLPPNMQRHIQMLRNPKLNWKIILRRFMFDIAKTDHTWRRPNKRYLPNYLPAVEGRKVGQIDFAIDVSGSINEETFFGFCSEVHAVLKVLKPSWIDLIQFDHDIEGVNRVRSVGDLLAVKFVGGGGTYLEPVMQHAIKSKSKAMIVLTDGWFSNNITDPQKPVIWCVYDNPDWQPPFGNVVHFSSK